MSNTLPGEIWRVDFGLAAKVRPALVLSDYSLAEVARLSSRNQAAREPGWGGW